MMPETIHTQIRALDAIVHALAEVLCSIDPNTRDRTLAALQAVEDHFREVNAPAAAEVAKSLVDSLQRG